MNEADLATIADDIVTKLIEFETHSASEQMLNGDLDGHISLLVIDLIRLYGACMFEEIAAGLLALINVADRKTIRKHLFLLEKLELIRRHKRGADYYVTKLPTDHIAYDFIEGTGREISDRTRLKMAVRSWFKENDEQRFAVVRRHVVGDDE